MTPNTQAPAIASHLKVSVGQNGELIAYRVLNLAEGEYRPLVKELAYRAVATDHALAGEPWRIALRLDDVLSEAPQLRLEALLGGPRGGRPLATLSVPIGNLTWIADQVARKFEVQGEYTMYVEVLAPDDPAVEHWATLDDNDDIELVDSSAPELRLPSGFSAEPLGPRRVIRSAQSWLRCLFTRRAFEMFLDAASRETAEERGWAAATRVHLLNGACYAVIEDLVEMPATAGRSFLVTHGRDYIGLSRRLGERLGGFCHLHPPTVEGEALSPAPSAADSVVAWNLDAATPAPIVAPIAMFGTTAGDVEQKMAAHGHQGGILSEIDLEVLP